MKYSILAGVAMLALAGLSSCQKANVDPQTALPPSTTTGAETLGFSLDGNTWIPAGQRCGIYGCADNKVEASSYVANGHRQLLLTAVRTDGGRNESFILQLEALTGPGVYRATAGGPGATGGEAGTKLYFANSRQGLQYQSQPGTATITITRLDTVQNIVAGTFEGQLSNLSGTGSVQVGSGRFDVLYNR
ncbi:hypothetical protein KB206_15710 [Microvirga sp. STS02]|uniref:hypothetical protein n=1 Tax=Hymenobacter negativus TaxID=2795026 RepID=UPI0018DDBD56|nr:MULTISPECIES: hypothetical protein [Bacteria]MBH8570338.1 hypothetical protein [Hymenobacter negativus]MBR7210077.1 hypothetical protein [Microvirga sp. STS02]